MCFIFPIAIHHVETCCRQHTFKFTLIDAFQILNFPSFIVIMHIYIYVYIYIYASVKQVIIRSDNDLVPNWHKRIFNHTIGKEFQCQFNQNTTNFIQMKLICKLLPQNCAHFSRPSCLMINCLYHE